MSVETPSPMGRSVVVREPESGGAFPDVSDLLQESITEFFDAIGPYLLGVLGLLIGSMAVGLAGAVVFGLLLVFAVVAGAGIGAVGDQLGSVGAALLAAVSVGVDLLFLGVAVVGMTMLTAPLTASFMRAVAAHQRGEAELQIGAAFGTLGQHLPQVVGVGAIVGGATFVGLLLCGLPALLVPLFLGFAVPMVALHGLSALEAARTNIAHVRDHLQQHAIIAAVTFALNVLSGMVPLLGPAFVMAFTVRAYRKIFGDGASPQLLLTTEVSAEIEEDLPDGP